MRKVFVQSMGCRASQADAAALESAFADCGFDSAPSAQDADVVVLNTCTVTNSADIDARRIIRNLTRDHPGVDIAVTGCYAQRAPNELADLPGVRWVIGNSQKTSLAQIVASDSGQGREVYHGQIFCDDFNRESAFLATPVAGVRSDRTRPNLKVQDGCGNRCSFCIIPAVRGPSRSAPLFNVVEQVSDLARRYAEVVLSGINLGRWGRDLPGRQRLADLLRVLLDRTAVRRLRISSVEPMDWSDNLLELVASEERIAKHIHLPLQSGSDAVLKRMFRKYRTRHYGNRLEVARRLMPDAAIGADVMTGFPGETAAEFQETVDFIKDQPFSYLHVFTFSERPGTAAAAYRDAVPVELRRERTRVLRGLGENKNREFRRGLINSCLSAVTLEERGMALTTNFVKVQMAKDRLPNQLVQLQIGSMADGGLREQSPLPVLQL